MRDALTAGELASLHRCIPLPAESGSGITRVAKRDNWKARPRNGRGGGREFPLATLPSPIRDAITQAVTEGVPAVCAVLSAPVPANTVPAVLPAPPRQIPVAAQLADWQRRTLEARAAILAEIDRMTVVSGSWRKAAEAVAASAQARTLRPELAALVPVANAKSGGKAGARTLSLRTLYRWAEAREVAGTAGAAALAPREAARPILVQPWAAALLTLYRQPQKPSLAWCLEEMSKRYPTIPAPSYDQARRFVKGLSPIERNRGRMGPLALKALKSYIARDTGTLWPTAAYSADGHTFDAEVQHPIHGRPFRPELTAVIDLKTRKIVGWSAALSENTWGVLDALRNACTSHGVPCIWYVDRGKGFNNDAMGAATDDEADDPATLGFLGRLGITKVNSIARNSQARGAMERVQGTVWVRAAKALPTYMGAPMDMEARQKAFKATRAAVKNGVQSPLLMSWTAFLEWAQGVVEAYNARIHSSLPKLRDPQTGRARHQTPAEAWEAGAAAPGVEIDIPSAAEAEDLFRPMVKRTPRRGLVELFGNQYHNRALEHVDGDVLVAYDIHDAEWVWVRDLDGRLICKAQWDAHKRDYFPKSVLDQAAERRSKAAVKRLAAHADTALAELGPRVIDHVPDPIPAELVADADAMFARLSGETTPAALPAPDDVRPIFADDESWARWLIEHPDAATDQDRALLTTELRRNEFRALLNLAGIDVAALTSIAADMKAQAYA
ncbi:Mu transposase C-terminal domain-containing protein [Azospirillum sp. 11R-A]|uniref:Mu transposase C-terminal domain-containing protein n=1 Tax=Azospirillum sp. 11R-A TaxID=3111634 RepID=UPI003C2577C3